MRPPRGLAAGAAALLLLSSATACKSSFADRAGARDPDQTVTFTVGGLQRSYILHKPAGAAADAKLPTVLVFHGGGGTPTQMISGTGFDAAADRAGFLAVYPAGYEKSWNDGRSGDTKANLAGVDDVAFVSALIDRLVAEDHADPARIYATGMSNGGMFTEALGCRLSGKLAAVAPVSGTLPAEDRAGCTLAKPLPVLEIHGTDDPIVPYDGGHVAITTGGGLGGPALVLSVADTQQLWRDKDGCTSAPSTSKLPDKAFDGTAVTIVTTAGCAKQSAVILYSVEGAGHTWPGGTQYLPAALVGKVTRQFSATDVIMEFFTAR